MMRSLCYVLFVLWAFTGSAIAGDWSYKDIEWSLGNQRHGSFSYNSDYLKKYGGYVQINVVEDDVSFADSGKRKNLKLFLRGFVDNNEGNRGNFTHMYFGTEKDDGKLYFNANSPLTHVYDRNDFFSCDKNTGWFNCKTICYSTKNAEKNEKISCASTNEKIWIYFSAELLVEQWFDFVKEAESSNVFYVMWENHSIFLELTNLIKSIKNNLPEARNPSLSNSGSISQKDEFIKTIATTIGTPSVSFGILSSDKITVCRASNPNDCINLHKPDTDEDGTCTNAMDSFDALYEYVSELDAPEMVYGSIPCESSGETSENMIVFCAKFRNKYLTSSKLSETGFCSSTKWSANNN